MAESDDPRDAGSAQLAVLHLTYEDGTDSWVKPKRWRAKQLPGGRPVRGGAPVVHPGLVGAGRTLCYIHLTMHSCTLPPPPPPAAVRD